MSDRVEAEGRSLGLLRSAGRATAVAGAVGSVGLTLWVGRRNPSLLLMAFFAAWVIGPFVGLVMTDAVSKRWSPLTRATLYSVMLVVGAASLAAYGDVVLRPRATPAFMFLVVPLCSWLLMVLAISMAAFISGRRTRGTDGAR